jgi:hypothetical protein
MQCEFIKESGEKCGANSLRNDKFCFMHSDDPEIIKIRQKSLSEGGSNSRKKYEPLIDEVDLENNADILFLIKKLIEETRGDKISTKKTTAIGYLLNIAIKALEQSDIEKRLSTIENAIKRQN